MPLNVSTGVFHKLLIYWNFHSQPSPGFNGRGGKNPLSSSSVEGNALLMYKWSEENRQAGWVTQRQMKLSLLLSLL